MKKKCSACKESKDLSEFRKDKSRKGGHAIQCASCASLAYKEAYAEKYGAKARERNNKRWNENRVKLVEYKRTGCARCDEKHIACLELHHLDPTEKEFGIGSALSRSWEHIEKELEKCIILCANCHRKEHHKDI